MDRERLYEEIKADEGEVLEVYLDHLGYLLLVSDTWSRQKMKSLENLPGQPLRLREAESSSIETLNVPLRTARDYTGSGTIGQKRFNS